MRENLYFEKLHRKPMRLWWTSRQPLDVENSFAGTSVDSVALGLDRLFSSPSPCRQRQLCPKFGMNWIFPFVEKLFDAAGTDQWIFWVNRTKS